MAKKSADSKIDAFDPNALKYLRSSFEDVFEVVANAYGIKINIGTMKYDDNTARFTVECVTINESGEALNSEAIAFKQCAALYDLKPSDLGRKFKSSGQTFTIVGCKPRSTRFPIIATREDGKRFKFSPHSIVGNFMK